MRILFYAALVAAIFMPVPVMAQACTMDYEKIKRKLTNTAKETLIWQGWNSNGALVEIWQSKEGRWTALRRYPNGPTCIVSQGHDATQFVWHAPEVSA